MSNTGPRLLLYSRHACHLCEVMGLELREYLLQNWPAVSVELRDVDASEAWRRAYGFRVPLLMSGCGEVLSEYQLDEALLQNWLQHHSAC